MRLTLENVRNGKSAPARLTNEVDLGEVAFVEIDGAWINAFINTNDDPEDPTPDLGYAATVDPITGVTVWHLRPEDMDITNDNWMWQAHRLNILP